MTPALLQLCADMLLTDQEVVTDFGLPALTDAEVATLNDAITAHTDAGNSYHVRSSQPEVSTWVLIGACAVLLKRWADECARPTAVSPCGLFREGDRVLVTSIDRIGTVVAVDGNPGSEILVQVGNPGQWWSGDGTKWWSPKSLNLLPATT